MTVPRDGRLVVPFSENWPFRDDRLPAGLAVFLRTAAVYNYILY
jgi:hypothetical protein